MLTASDLRPHEAAAPGALTWQLPIKHFSASSIAKASCPEQWRQRYILKKQESRSGALVVGSAVHATFQENFTKKLVTGVDLDPGTIADVYDASWKKEVARDDVDWGKDSADTVRAKGLQMVSVYMDTVAPRLEPLAVEQKFLAPLVPGLPLPIMGFIDLVVPGRGIDYKTAARAVRGVKPEWRFQGLIYQMVKPFSFEWHVLTKTKEPQVFTPLDAPDLSLAYDPRRVAAMQKFVRTVGWTLNYFYVTLGWDHPWPTMGVYTDGKCHRCAWMKDCSAWGGDA